MIRKLFSKKVRLFGKAIPLTFLILAVIATTALAGWMLMSRMTAQFGTLAIGPVFADNTGSAIVKTDAGIPGVTCTIDGTVLSADFSVGMGSADVGDECEFSITMKNDGDHDLYVGPLSNDPTYTGAFLVDEVYACGQLISAGSIQPLTWFFELTDLSDPATTYGPTDLDIVYTVAVPTCP